MKGLREASRVGMTEMIDKMIENGANNWNEALKSACYSGNIEVVKKFIEKGATNFSEVLPIACEYENFEIVKLLIEKGANSFDEALRSASLVGDMNMINYLIEKGACPFDNCLLNSCLFKNKEIAEYLITKGADPSSKIGFNKTAFQIAIDKGYYPMIVLMIYHGISLENFKPSCLTKKGLIEMIEDAKKGKLWNTKRNQFFPKIFQNKLFSFFLSLKLFSSNNKNLKIPRPILYLILQFFLENEIELKKNSRTQTKCSISEHK